ncbi:MAG: hypothetical protein C0501_07810 [Isosphaera sp.]|nr:hypothetical protein [Isosphaera sp.]
MSGALAPILLVLCPTDDPVRVTVVVVLATDADAKVDPKLVDLARQVQKRDDKLTGFVIHATEAKSVAVGGSHTFALVEKQELKVTVARAKDADGRVSLTIKPPGLENVTYGCVCDKFFPVVTPHRTKDGKVLIVAVMAKPCTAGKKKD